MTHSVRSWVKMLAVFASLAALVAVIDAADEGGRGKRKGAGKGKGGARGHIVQVDLSRLPPGLAKQVLKYAEASRDHGSAHPGARGKGKGKGAAASHGKGKGGQTRPHERATQMKGKGKAGRSISLGEAVSIAESLGQGQAVTADRRGEGADATFRIELFDRDGQRRRVTLDAAGRRSDSVMQPPRQPRGKGKGKKFD